MPAPPAEMVQVVERLLPLHDRLCPRQILGARIGLLAGALLGLELPRRDKRVLAIVETDGCFVDGVAEATGCRVGRRTMRVVDHGKVAAVFVDVESGEALRIWPRRDARRRAVLYAPESPDRWQAQLDGYYRMPPSELLHSESVRLSTSLAAVLGQPGVRVECDACGEEVMNNREITIAGRPLCRGCVGEAYCSTAAPSPCPPGRLPTVIRPVTEHASTYALRH
jgi:formylmethanofuran dehydrogenase subunit E